MAAAPQRSESYKAQREVEDLNLVLRARSGNRASEAEIIRRYAASCASLLELLHRRRRSRRPRAGGPRRPLQGDPRLPRRQGHDVPLVRRALHHPPDHHRHQDGHAAQAPPLNGALSFSHTPAGYDDGSDFTLGDALPGSPIDDPARRVVATEELAALVGCLARASRRSRAACSRSTSRAAPTRRSASSSTATRRPSTTPSSASSARSASISPRAPCSTPESLRSGRIVPRRRAPVRVARPVRSVMPVRWTPSGSGPSWIGS